MHVHTMHVLLLVVTALAIKESTCRIIGGQKVQISSYPYQVAFLGQWNTVHDGVAARFVGGAFIISKYWAMTAGHIIASASEYKFYTVNQSVLIGNCENYRIQRHCRLHYVVKNITHQYYDPLTSPKGYDIALVKVARPFDGPNEKPLKLAGHRYRVHDHSLAHVTGWGGISPITQDVYFLRAAEFEIWKFAACKKLYSKDLGVFLEEGKLLCAGGNADNIKDTCGGDSGGPLVQNGVALGIIIFGQQSCGQYDYPAVFTRIAHYQEWLEDHNRWENIGIHIASR